MITNKKCNQKARQQEENIVKLQRLIKYAKTKKGQEVMEEERNEVNEKLKILGKKEGANLPKLQRHWSEA